MTSIIAVFFTSLAMSLLLTPQIARLARKYHIVDTPSERKVHTRLIPRAGGVAICLAFFTPFVLGLFHPTKVLKLTLDQQVIMLATGALLVFGLGLWDDIRSLSPRIKFAVQIMAALIACQGGVAIKGITVFSYAYPLGWLSLPVTVFWFLLVINAINLIDGLDGLAAGISLFISLVLLIISVTTGRFLMALGFAALAGSTLGFLKYNFNPASVFMGDSGSYFLGYLLAGFAIMGSLKGPATVAILIPVIALGVPLMDVLFAPIRRFLMGQRLFSPDRNHLHHRLLKLGLTHRNAVLTLYGISILTGSAAIVAVHAKDEGIALLLFILGTIIILGMRKLGYVNRYFGLNKMHDWVRDVSDEMGISRERRNFLSFQLEIYDSGDMKTLWGNVCRALDILGFDMAEMKLEKQTLWENIHKALGRLGFDTSKVLADRMLISEEDIQGKMSWKRDGFDSDDNNCPECFLKMQLPLIGQEGQSFGAIWLVKDLRRESISHCTLRRVEHLRRTVLGSLQVLMGVAPR